MNTITSTADLQAFCEEARRQPYVTLDTEFLRERTYYAKLCLVQLALPGRGDAGAVLVDPLVEGLSLDPLFALLHDPGVVKVLHAARQDLEIFYVQGGVIPTPLFDTQVAAMVCGHGEQAGYETLVRKIARASVDKTSRFTDWSRRPLSEAQKAYALADVTHLRVIYEELAAELQATGRAQWVDEELAVLADPATYVTTPDDAWRRIKTRTASPRFLAVVRELARFREQYAQENDVPRSRVFKDDALLEIAAAKPKSTEDLSRLRLLTREGRRGPVADAILAAVADGLACPKENLPEAVERNDRPQGAEALGDLLRVLLKARAEASGVAAKLIATTSDLEDIAAGARDLPALKGWRREVFGEAALQLCRGEVALAAADGAVRIVPAGQGED